MPQSGDAVSASRPASTAQLTGLKPDAVCIQSGIRSFCMKVTDRNESGSIGTASARSPSPRAAPAARARSRAPRTRPRAGSRRRSAPATPTTPFENSAPAISASPMMITVWTTICSDACASRPVISDERRTGETRNRSTTPRSRSSIIGIPLQPAGEERRHHHDPGREELDVVARAEARDVGDRLEQRAEQQQPDRPAGRG